MVGSVMIDDTGYAKITGSVPRPKGASGGEWWPMGGENPLRIVGESRACR